MLDSDSPVADHRSERHDDKDGVENRCRENLLLSIGRGCVIAVLARIGRFAALGSEESHTHHGADDDDEESDRHEWIAHREVVGAGVEKAKSRYQSDNGRRHVERLAEAHRGAMPAGGNGAAGLLSLWGHYELQHVGTQPSTHREDVECEQSFFHGGEAI